MSGLMPEAKLGRNETENGKVSVDEVVQLPQFRTRTATLDVPSIMEDAPRVPKKPTAAETPYKRLGVVGMPARVRAGPPTSGKKHRLVADVTDELPKKFGDLKWMVMASDGIWDVMTKEQA